MTNETLKLCELFIHNRDAMKKAFSWDTGFTHAVCACVLTLRGHKAEESVLLSCKDLIKRSFGVFSNFRGNARTFTAAVIASVPSPEKTLLCAADIYKKFREKKLPGSDFLPIAAVMLAVYAEPYDHTRLIERTRELYMQIKDCHPFLTSYEDAAYCALLSMSDRGDSALLADMEECYRLLKPNFMSSNPVQSLSHLLSLWTSSPSDKCARVVSLYDAFKSHRRRYDSEFGLPTLGVLAMAGGAPHKIVENVLSVDEWLSHQEGFGFWSSITKQHRLIFASILSENEYLNSERMQLSVICSALSIIIAQQQSSAAAT